MAGCGSADSAEAGGADQPYRVLVTGGISAQGVLKANADTSILATKAGVEVQNQAGGIGGRKIELTVVDDAGDATIAVTKVREAINKQKPDLVLNSGPSSVGAAVLPILKQNKILSFNVAPTQDSTDPSKFPLNFDLAPGAADNARGIVGHAKEKGYDSIGVIHGSTAYGELFGKEMTTALESAGLKQAGNEEYEATALDMTAQLQALKNAGARPSRWTPTVPRSATSCRACSVWAGTCRWSVTPRWPAPASSRTSRRTVSWVPLRSRTLSRRSSRAPCTTRTTRP